MKSIPSFLSALPLFLALLLSAGCGDNTPPAPDNQTELALPGVGSALPETASPDAVVATVNDQPVTHGDVQREAEIIRNQMSSRMPPEMIMQMRGQITEWAVESAVVKALLVQTVEAEDISVEAQEIDDTLAQFVASLPPPMTLEKFLEMNAATEDDFKENISTDLRMQKLLARQTDDVEEPTEEAIAAFYEANLANYQIPESAQTRHILLAVTPETPEEEKTAKREKAESLRQQLIDGADFDSLAKEHSEGPSQQNGGKLPPFSKGQMVPEFEAAAFAQSVDEIGPIVETSFGYHIIQVLAREEGRTVSLEEAHEQVALAAAAQTRREAIEAYIQGLKAKAAISFAGTP